MAVRLRVTNEANEDEETSDHLFNRDRVTIGRGGENHLVLDDPKKIVSTEHAEVRKEGGTYQLVDRGSKNFTYYRDQRLTAGESQPLSDGDEFRMGDFTIEFQSVDLDTTASSEGETVFAADFSNPFSDPAGDLVEALETIADAYEQEAEQRREDALQEAFGDVDADLGSHDAVYRVLELLGVEIPSTNGGAASPSASAPSDTPASDPSASDTDAASRSRGRSPGEATGESGSTETRTRPDAESSPEPSSPSSGDTSEEASGAGTEPAPDATAPQAQPPHPPSEADDSADDTAPGGPPPSGAPADTPSSAPAGGAGSSGTSGDAASTPPPSEGTVADDVADEVIDTLLQSLSRIVNIPWQFRHEFIGQTIMQSSETEFIYDGDAETMKRHLMDPSLSQEERRKRLKHVRDAAESLAVHQVAMLNGYKASVMNGVEELMENLDPEEHQAEVQDENPVYQVLTPLASAAALDRVKEEWEKLHREDWSVAEQRIFRPAFIKAYLARMTAQPSDDN